MEIILQIKKDPYCQENAVKVLLQNNVCFGTVPEFLRDDDTDHSIVLETTPFH